VIRAHKNAIIARLEADSTLAGRVFEGEVEPDSSRQRYVTVWINSGARSPDRLTGPSAKATFTITLHSVATTPDQAQYVAERVHAQLVDWTPTVPGRRCRRLTHEVSLATQKDADITPALWYQVDEFDLVSDPA